MRHVGRAALRAVAAVSAALVLAGCVPQPPDGVQVAQATGGGDVGGQSVTTSAAPSTSATPSTSTSAPPVSTTSAAPSTSTSTSAPPSTSAAPSTSTSKPAAPLTPLPAAEYSATSPTPVLPALDDTAAQPTTTGLSRVLGPLLADDGLGKHVVVDVADVGTGASLLSRDASTPATPASTTKLLTAVASLSVLGPQERLATSVVQGDGTDVVLVAGGDALLTTGHGDPGAVVGHAGLADLADDAATALLAAGHDTVTLRLDDSLFTGPRIADGWKPGDLTSGFVAPIAPLAVESGRARTGAPAKAPDPALAAAKAFARLLERRGVTVQGGVTRGQAPADRGPFARVLSATVSDVVEHALAKSDNTVAEVLARLVAARTGRPATFDGAGAAVLGAVAALGVPTDGARFEGGSGLSRGGVIAPITLTTALQVAASDAHPELRATLTGLPVAGVTGTLADRYTARDQRDGVGVVRAKTGTLTGASSLAGVVVDTDGQLLVFAVLADRVKVTRDARDVLDSIASALAGCGCG